MSTVLRKVSYSSFVKVRILKCPFVSSNGPVISNDVHSFYSVRLNSKLEAKNGKTTNVKFSFKVKFNSDQAALNMKTAINKALTGVKTNADSNENWTKPKIPHETWKVKIHSHNFVKSFVNLCTFCIFRLNFEENKERLLWSKIILVIISSGKDSQISKGIFNYLHSSRMQQKTCFQWKFLTFRSKSFYPDFI